MSALFGVWPEFLKDLKGLVRSCHTQIFSWAPSPDGPASSLGKLLHAGPKRELIVCSDLASSLAPSRTGRCQYLADVLRKSSLLQEALFVSQVVTIITFHVFIVRRCSFKECFTHGNINVPNSSGESVLYEATRTQKGDVLEVTSGIHR